MQKLLACRGDRQVEAVQEWLTKATKENTPKTSDFPLFFSVLIMIPRRRLAERDTETRFL